MKKSGQNITAKVGQTAPKARQNIDFTREYGGTEYIVRAIFIPEKSETISQKVERLLLK